MLAALAFGAVPAQAGTSPTVDFQYRFLTPKPGVASAVHLYVFFKAPGDPNGKPKALRHLDILPPAGSRFDPSAVPVCEATDAEYFAMGDAACPPSSRLGNGGITVITGFGTKPFDPYPTDVTLFNNGSGWIEESKDPSSHQTVAVGHITRDSRGHFVANPPFEPGVPPDGASVRLVDFVFHPAAAWATTPPRCDGEWTTRASFGFVDGSTQDVSDTMPCERGAGGASSGPRGHGRGRHGRVRPERRRRTRRHRVRHRRH